MEAELGFVNNQSKTNCDLSRENIHEEEESKCWRLVKCKINAKCRSKRFERALREK